MPLAATIFSVPRMNGYGSSSDENAPVTYLNGYPLYAAHFIAAVFSLSMLATTLCLGLNAGAVSSWITFSSDRVLSGQIWRIFSYGLWNPPALQFVADMFMIVWFGLEIEKFFGRKKFLILYGCLYLLTPTLFTALGFFLPLQLSGELGAFALFIAFATLYPNQPLLFNVPAQWMAFLLVSLFSLMAIASRDTVGLITLWTTCGFAFAFIRYEQGVFTLTKLWRFARPSPPRATSTGRPQKIAPSPSAAPEATMAEVDALLDKIAKSGIASLTSKERARLETARSDLLQRKGDRR